MLTFIFSSQATADEAIRISFTESFKPYSYRDNGQWKGIDIEIGRELHKRMGLEVQYYPLPWARSQSYAEKGLIGGLLTAYCEDKRSYLETSSESFYTVKISLFARKDVAAKTPINDLMDLPKHSRVGVIIDNFFNDMINGHPYIEKAFTHSSALMPRQLFHRRIDYALEEYFPFIFYSRESGFAEEFQEVLVLREFRVCAVFSKAHFGPEKSRALAERASEVIRELKQSGFVDATISKYIDPNNDQSPIVTSKEPAAAP